MSSEGNQGCEIVIKQEPIEGDDEECLDDNNTVCNGSNFDFTAVKEEVKVESTNELCTDNVYMVVPQVKDEIKKENSCENSLSSSGICDIWLDSRHQDQYYSENCKDDPEEESQEGLQEYFPDIMPHFLSSGTETDQLIPSKVVSCHKCGELCTAENFMEHIQLRHKHKPQLTQSRRTLRSKIKKKSRKYVYPCPYCGKCFANFSQLKVHVRTHTQEKPHKCPFCDYQGNQTVHVDIHIESKHLKVVKPFKCEMCDYSSSTLNCLKKHKRTHGKKPEPRQCPYCEVTTIKGLTMKNHIKKKHKTILKRNIK